MKGNAKCKHFRFEPPFGGLRGNAQGSSIAFHSNYVPILHIYSEILVENRRLNLLHFYLAPIGGNPA